MIIRTQTLWQYIGEDVRPGQFHLVVFSSHYEIITIGLPHGHGGSWLGKPEVFSKQFIYKGEAK